MALPHISRCKAPEGFPRLIDCLNEVLDAKKTMNYTIASEEVSATMTIAPHSSSADELIGAIIVVSDNTKDLIDARNELRLNFDSVPEAILVTDENGDIQKANVAAGELLGVGHRDAEGKNKYDYLHASIRDQIHDSDVVVLKSGVPIIDEIKPLEYTSGKKIWARVSRIPIKEPDQDSALLYVVIQDITDEYRANENLALSERRLNAAIDATGLGIWERDFKTGEVYWSEEMLNLVALTTEDLPLTFEFFNSLVHPDDLDRIDLARVNHIENGEPYFVQYRMKNKGGRYFWC